MQQKLARYVYKVLFQGQCGLEFLSKYIVAQSIFTATCNAQRVYRDFCYHFVTSKHTCIIPDADRVNISLAQVVSFLGVL